MNRKAYKIKTDVDDYDGYSIFSAENAGRAKTMVMYSMREAFQEATYSWIKYCRRAKEYDNLAEKYSGCLYWQFADEYWIIQEKI